MERTDYVRKLFDTEVAAAREHLDAFSLHADLAQTLGDKYGFGVPGWQTSVPLAAEPSDEAKSVPDISVNGGGESEGRDEEAPDPPSVPSKPEMVVNYYRTHLVASEPKPVDDWARQTYPDGDFPDYSIGQTMHRMAKKGDGRLYKHLYPEQTSALYGLPEWRADPADPSKGFAPQHLPQGMRDFLRSLEGFQLSYPAPESLNDEGAG